MDSLNLCFPVRIPKASFLECDITIGNIIITEKHTPVWKKAEVSGELQRKYRRSIKGMWRWKLRMLREVMGKYSCAIYRTNRKLYGENYSEHKSSECSNEGCENEAWIHRKTDFLNAIIHIFAPLKWQNSKASMSSFFFITAQVFCNMEVAGGGWTVIQHREDGSLDFQKGWKEYKMVRWKIWNSCTVSCISNSTVN